MRLPKLKTKIRFVFAVLCILSLLSPVQIAARSIDDIQREIDEKNKSLSSVKDQLANAEKNLRNIEGSINSAQGEIPRLEGEIKQIQAQIEVNKLQMEESSETQKLKQLEQEDRETRQVKAIKNAYQSWRSLNGIDASIVYGTETNMKHEVYQAEVSGKELSSIENLIEQIEEIEDELADLAKQNGTLAEQNVQLEQRRQQLQAQIIALQSSRVATSGAVSGLRTQTNVLKASISQLSAEQKVLQDYEAWLLGQSNNAATNPLVTGQLYFTGKGREYYTGHGVGMSQYGAYGLANSGWNATQILTHYYTGVSVGSYPASQEITIRYCQGNPVFVAYQTGCGAAGPDITERVSLDQYLAGLGEMPNNWPLEARKAQMIAARTYALRYTGNGNPAIPICLTTYCQVSYIKNGDQAEMDAVLQTKDLVITSGGALIEALYSADNNNGWGTADNDTVFSGIDGNGTPYSYLRAVQEPAGIIQYPTYGSNWAWRTNSYTYANLDSMLAFAQGDGYLSAGSRNYIASIRTAIGNISSINFQRDASGRVKKVIFTGTNGASMPMAGWFFKTVWNSWVDQVQPTGQKDFIYSLTYFLLTAG